MSRASLPRPGPAPNAQPQPLPAAAAFTLVELLVVIAIIGLLAGLAMTSLGQVRAMGQRVKCLNNMKEVGAGFIYFVGDNDGRLPGRVRSSNKWPALLTNYLGSTEVYACPSDPENFKRKNLSPTANGANNTSYIFNGFNEGDTYNNEAASIRIFGVPYASTTALLGEAKSGDPNFYMDFVEGNHESALDLERHGDRLNVVFLDGSARTLQRSEYSHDIWKIEKDYELP